MSVAENSMLTAKQRSVQKNKVGTLPVLCRRVQPQKWKINLEKTWCWKKWLLKTIVQTFCSEYEEIVQQILCEKSSRSHCEMDITSSRERGVSNKRAASPNENGNYWSDTTANAAYSKLNEAGVAKQRRVVADAAVDKTKLSVQPPMKKTRGSSSVEQVVATKKPVKPSSVAVAVTKTKKPVRATASAAMTKMKKPSKVIAVPKNQKLTKMKDKVAFALARDKKSKSSSSSSSSVATSTSTAVVATNKPWKKMSLAEKVSIAVQRAAASEEKQKEEKRLKQMNKLAKRQGKYTLNALFNILSHTLYTLS